MVETSGTGPSGTGPSTGLYLLAGFVAGSSVLITATLGAARASELVDRVRGYDRFDPPGTVEIPVDDPGDYSVYYEVDSSGYSDEAMRATDFGLTLLGPDGSGVPLHSSDVSYSWGGRKGVAVGSFDAEQPGTYTLRAQAGGGRLAVGESVPSGFLYGFGTTLLVGLGLVVASVVLSVVVAVGRRRGQLVDAGGPGPSVDPDAGRRRLVVVAGVGAVAVVVAGAALASVKQEADDVVTSLEPVDSWSSSSTTDPCMDPANMDLDMCGPTPEELREMNLDYADRMAFSGDEQAAWAVAGDVRAALAPLAGQSPTPSEAEVLDALGAWPATVSSNAVRTSGTAFAVSVDGGCVFGSVHDGIVDVDVGGYVNDGGCLASYGH